MSPRVSVIITTYNYARYLRQCVESALDQTRPPDEVIVVDDESEDETPEIMQQYADVKYVRQPHAGATAAFNRGFEIATGNIICRLDADDYWLPSKLQAALSAFQEYPNAGGFVNQARYVDGDDNLLYEPPVPNSPPAVWSFQQSALSLFVYLPSRYRGGLVVPNTVCVRKTAVEDLFPLPIELGLAVDGVLYFASARHGLICCPEVLGAYRHHGSNQFVGHPEALSGDIFLLDWIANHPRFKPYLDTKGRALLKAKRLETQMLYCRALRKRWSGLGSGLSACFALARHGVLPHWKSFVVAFLCLSPEVYGWVRGWKRKFKLRPDVSLRRVPREKG